VVLLLDAQLKLLIILMCLLSFNSARALFRCRGPFVAIPEPIEKASTRIVLTLQRAATATVAKVFLLRLFMHVDVAFLEVSIEDTRVEV